MRTFLWRRYGFSASLKVLNLIAHHRFPAFWATAGCSQLSLKGGALPAVKDEEKVDYRRHAQD
jgi:hypothetical protein